MILSIIGIVIGIIAIGLFFWLKNDQNITNDLIDSDVRTLENALTSFMTDHLNFQVATDRKIAELEKELEIKTKQLERSLNKIKKDLPTSIRKVISHIEFAKPLDK